VSGMVCVNGTPIIPTKYKQHIAYCMQDPALMETVTPREALEFSAALRLAACNTDTCSACCVCCRGCDNCGQGDEAYGLDDDADDIGAAVDLNALVDAALKDLQLDSCADLYIGGVLIKGAHCMLLDAACCYVLQVVIPQGLVAGRQRGCL
jgi:hypothetical protein